MMKRLLLVTSLLVSGQAWSETLFINDATVHTMGIRSTMQDADILIRDGYIQGLGVDLAAPADATVIEAEGRPVTPACLRVSLHMAWSKYPWSTPAPTILLAAMRCGRSSMLLAPITLPRAPSRSPGLKV